LNGKYNAPIPTKSELQKNWEDFRKQVELLTKIQDAEKGLYKGSQAKQSQASETVKNLRKQLDEMTRDEKDLQKSKDRVKKQMAELKRRMETGDFSKPAKRDKKTDKELDDLQDRLIKTQYEYVKMVSKKALENRTNPQKYMDWAADVLSIPRGLMSSADFSAPLRQGLVMTVAHPLLALNAAGEMFLQAVNQKRFDRWLHRLQESDEFQIMKSSGLYISDLHNPILSAREEEFMSNLADKVPIIGSSFKVGGVKIPGLNIIKGSQRAYVSYLNKLRADVFMQMVDALKDEHPIASNPDLYKSLAEWVNTATGRGSLPKMMETAAPLLNATFFSPRLMSSRLTLLNPLYYARVPKPLRKMIWGDMGKFVGVAMMMLFLFSLDDDLEVELDPRSSDFLKIKYGNTRYDVLGGISNYLRFGVQVSTNERKTKGGEIVSYEKRSDIAERFFRSKLAPVPSMIWNLADGEDVVGNEYGPGDIFTSFIPLAAQDITEAVEDKGPQMILKAGLPAMFGIGVQTYGGSTDKEDRSVNPGEAVSR